MSNVAIFNPSANVPAFAKTAGVSAVAKALAGGGGGAGKRISIKGGVFRLYVDGKQVTAIEDRHLDVVIVNAAPKITRTFYAKQYDENNPAPPDCWSADGEKPDPSAASRQSATCATCPKNIKGSGQGDSKACRYSQRIAVVLANDQEGHVLQMSLPATSIFGKAEGENRPLQDYARYLTAQGIDPTMLVTRLKFDTAAATPKLFFKPMRWLVDEEFAICQAQGQSEDALKAITMTVAQMDGVQAPPAEAPVSIPGNRPKAAQAQAQAPAPAPAAQQQDDDEPPPPSPKTRTAAQQADAGEPVVRQAAAPAPAAPQGGLAATLAAWDDE